MLLNSVYLNGLEFGLAEPLCIIVAFIKLVSLSDYTFMNYYDRLRSSYTGHTTLKTPLTGINYTTEHGVPWGTPMLIISSPRVRLSHCVSYSATILTNLVSIMYYFINSDYRLSKSDY